MKAREMIRFAHALGGLWLVALLLAPLEAARAEPARYRVDPEHASVGFLIEHIGYAQVLGMFRKVEGSYTFDESSGTLSDVRVVIDTESVFTNHRKRDDHLRGADFLNSREFPEMVFTAASAERRGEREFVIAGELELLGVKRPLNLTATWNKSAQYPIGSKPYVMGVSARGSLQRGAFGMDYALANGWVGDEVALIIEFEAIRE